MTSKFETIKIIVFATIIALLSSQGWSSSREIEKHSFVLMQGVDAAPGGEFDLTYSIALPEAMSGEGGGGSAKEANFVHKTRCKALWQGAHDIQAELENPLYFGHVQARILGEEQARRGVSQILDVYLRPSESRRKAWIVVADGKAEKLIEATPKGSSVLPLFLGQVLEMQDYLNAIPPMRVAEFSAKVYNPGEQAVIPIIKAEKDRIAISGLALFKEDKMVGKLDYDEMHYLLLVSSGKGHAFKQFETDNGDIFVFRIQNVKRRVKPHLNGNQVSFAVSLEIEGNIIESASDGSLKDPKFLSQVEHALSTALEKDCQAVLHRVQKEFKVDSYSFGSIVRARYPKVWKEMDWNKEFPDIPINITVNAQIRRLGMVAR
ncbi:MAG: Ger(x)C family spore germination protein [bacterium]